MTSPINHVRR